MWNHTKEVQDGVATENDYKLTIEGQFTDSLTRQVDEDIRLRESGWGPDDDVWIGCGKTGPKCVLLNSQGDYYKPKSIRTQFRQM